MAFQCLLKILELTKVVLTCYCIYFLIEMKLLSVGRDTCCQERSRNGNVPLLGHVSRRFGDS